MKKATAIGLLCFLLLQFLRTASSKGVNVAYQRPVQTNLRSHHSHGSAHEAVDEDKYGTKTCFENLDKFKTPWLQIDLGKQLWVEKVSIKSRMTLSNIDIRIGNIEADLTANSLCRKSLRIPTFTSISFSCAEPMLGRYVYIAAKEYFQLCNVQVFLNADAIDTNIKYLVNNNRYDKGMLEKGEYRFKDHSPDKVSAEIDLKNPRRTVRVARKDFVIDLPPKAESLTFNAAVLIPVKRSKDSSNDKCESKGDKSEQKYINGAVSKAWENGVVTIKARYTTLLDKEREHIFRCSKGDVRMEGDICQLQNKCGDLSESKCDTKFISPLFPPGSYYCKCNPGFASSSSTKLPIENYVLPGEKCIKARPPQIWHSNQNLALLKKAIASSTDNFEGCKKENCKEKEAFARFAVDGNPRTCFRSHAENKPWILVYLGDLQPVSLVRIHSAKSQTRKRNSGLKDLGVFVGNGKSHFIKCAVEELLVDDQETSFGCNSELYVFGNSVMITTKDPVLRLCEVEVYAYTYGNIIGRKQYSYPTKFSRLAIDGDIGTCFKAQNGRHRHAFWWLILGKNVRVELVFILLHATFQWKNTSIEIGGKVCTIIRAYGARKGNYFECSQPVTGTRLLIMWSPAYVQYIQLCEVEVFQTKIINLAGKRLTKSSKNEKESYRGSDQKLDKPFSTGVRPRSKEVQWWSVDLIALCKIHLVRIVTASGYKPQHLKGLRILVDAGENAFGRGRRVARLDSPTEEPVQTITLPKNVKARFVTLALRNGGLELQFREVEIYNGPLLAIDECKKPNICPSNLKCVNGKKSYACVCPDGFREIGPNKCEEIKECIPPCAAENSFCDKSFGSYKCKCPLGFDPSFGDKGILLRCQDVNECEKPRLNRCGNTTTCVNARGFYNCTCRNGYNLDKKGIKFECKDIDECVLKDSCHVDASCSNTPGSYKCTCSHGLGGDGYKSCLKLPRCSSGQCRENAVCKDFKGINLCDCKEGYHFKGKICVDTNECNLNKDICGSNSVCSNTAGSYRCNCEVGFESKKDDGKNCYEINECEKREICGDTAVCEDIFGSYKCNCPDGFTFDKTQKKCVDNDECTISHSCPSNMICTNTFGSYSCSCRQGYRSDKLYCADIDECEEDAYDCPQFSRCKNQNGSYECPCKDGYRKAPDGTCSEICFPECEENSYCQAGKCLCERGFSLGPDLACQAAFLGSSGVSFHSRVLLLLTSLLWFLVLMWFAVLLQ